MNPSALYPVLLLAGSNLVMNVAWYGHLKVPNRALWIAVLASWGLAFFEYWMAVPANRIGSRVYSLAELKTLQEVMSLSTFLIVAWVMFDSRPGLSQLAGMALIAAGAFLVYKSPLG